MSAVNTKEQPEWVRVDFYNNTSIFVGPDALDRARAFVIAQYAQKLAQIAQDVIKATRCKDCEAVCQHLRTVIEVIQEDERVAQQVSGMSTIDFTFENFRKWAEADLARISGAINKRVARTYLPSIKVWQEWARWCAEEADGYLSFAVRGYDITAKEAFEKALRLAKK